MIYLMICSTILSVDIVDDESKYCVLKDHISLYKIFIRQTKEVNMPRLYFNHTTVYEDTNDTVSIYFTLCGNLPRSLLIQCGIEDDSSVYTMIEITNGSICTTRRYEDMVVSRYYTSDDKEKIDILYRHPVRHDMVMVRVFMNGTSVGVAGMERSARYKKRQKPRVFEEKVLHQYEVDVHPEYVYVKGMYFFSPKDTYWMVSVSVIMFVLYILCTFYYNHLSEIRSFFPFNFYINYYITYRLCDYTVQVLYYPSTSRNFTTPFILIVPVILGYLMERRGPSFTYYRSLKVFYVIVFTDVFILYLSISPYILIAALSVLLMTVYIDRISFCSSRLKNRDEWILSIVLSINMLYDTTHLIRSIRNYGAVRMILFDVSSYYSAYLMVSWVGGMLFMLPVLSYVRYVVSDGIINEEYEKKNMEAGERKSDLSAHDTNNSNLLIEDDDAFERR